jgi:hypothetical protein
MIPDHAALIPRGSPLAVGRRADLVAILLTRNLVDVMDTIAQFAELRVRLEPDTARDPLDAAEQSVVDRPGRRLNKGDVPLTTARAADPAHRRIEAVIEAERALDVGRMGYHSVRALRRSRPRPLHRMLRMVVQPLFRPGRERRGQKPELLHLAHSEE